ncbi:ATP-grasp domain-containing protein [Paraburkholderia youngii]|uniref:ATP-grasp domain-containing protein n=1 Tax=Paraburkholderia youngii TaxID=2782701 RepID=UPI003D25824F
MKANPPAKGNRIVVLNRWSDGFAAYQRYIDHAANKIAYVCTPNSVAALDTSRVAHVEQLSDILDEEALHAAVRACSSALGGIDRLVALSEFDLIAAARLRNSFNIPGDLPETVVRFRNKAVTKNTIAAAGLRVPRFAALEDLAVAKAATTTVMRFPIIVKPRSGTANIGSRRIETRPEFDALWPTLSLAEYDCEEYIDGPVYHVDGFLLNGTLVIARASRYINTYVQFAQGKPLGSVMLDPSPLNEALTAFSGKCLRALDFRNGPFHLEIIRGCDGLYFLEVGARVGEGEIPFLFHDLYGVDLFALWAAQQSGDKARLATQLQAALDASASSARGGFLMLPEPVGKVFVDAKLLREIPALYEAVFPKPHHFFDGTGGYATLLARFRYRAASEHEIATGIHTTLDNFQYTLAEIAARPFTAEPAAPMVHAGRHSPPLLPC